MMISEINRAFNSQITVSEGGVGDTPEGLQMSPYTSQSSVGSP